MILAEDVLKTKSASQYSVRSKKRNKISKSIKKTNEIGGAAMFPLFCEYGSLSHIDKKIKKGKIKNAKIFKKTEC